MKKGILLVLMAVGLCSAQSNLNWKGQDTAQFVNFRADSFFLFKSTFMSNGERISVVVVADDTSAAGRGSDSLKFIVGFQLGHLIYGMNSVKYDTAWTNRIAVDTFNSLTAANFYNPYKGTGATPWATNASDIYLRTRGQLDTTISTSATALIVPFFRENLYWAPYIKFYIKGLTGNKVGAPIKGYVSFQQRAYINVRQF